MSTVLMKKKSQKEVGQENTKKTRNTHVNPKAMRAIENHLTRDMSKYKASIEAGYSHGVAHSLGPFRSKASKKYIEQRMAEIKEKYDSNLEWKMHKLQRIAEIHAPSDSETMEEMNASVAIDAIKEMNKMEGHYAPERAMNLNLNVEAPEVIEARNILECLKKKYQREY